MWTRTQKEIALPLLFDIFHRISERKKKENVRVKPVVGVEQVAGKQSSLDAFFFSIDAHVIGYLVISDKVIYTLLSLVQHTGGVRNVIEEQSSKCFPPFARARIPLKGDPLRMIPR
jgi:hypothetical protein